MQGLGASHRRPLCRWIRLMPIYFAMMRLRTGKIWSTWLARLVCAVVVILAAGGCQGTGRGPLAAAMARLVGSLDGQDARLMAADAFDDSDADKRRRAVAYFSAAPYGGQGLYLRVYRIILGGMTEGDPTLIGPPDPDATVRAAAVKALSLHGSVDDAMLLTRRLDDESVFVRWEAAMALGRIHHPDTIRPLLRAMHAEQTDDLEVPPPRGDQGADVRQACAAALGQYATPAVFDALVGALDDNAFGVAHAARRSLVTLTGQDLGPEPNDWLKWENRNRGNLFKNQKVYTWQPFRKPHGLLDKAQFWKKPPVVASRLPSGWTFR